MTTKKIDTGFMDSFITVYHVGADGKLTELKTKKDAEKVLKEEEE